MGKFTFTKVLLIMTLAIMPMSLFAQNDKPVTKPANDNHWFVDADLGGTLLTGDNNVFQFSRMKFNARIGGGYAFAKHFSAYAKIGAGYLGGFKKGLFETNFSNYFDYSANFAVDLVSLIGGYKEDRLFGLKLHVGIGQIQYKAKATAQDGTVYTYGYKGITEKPYKGNGIGGRKVALEIPLGLEFNFNVSKLIDIYADFNANSVDSDALDGFKHGKRKDWYATGNVGVRFKLGCKKAPVVVEEKPVVVEEQVKVEEPAKVEEPVEEKVEETPVYTTSNIEVCFMKNTAEINTEKSGKSIENFKANCNGLKIEKVVINGFASPEGKPEFNDKISLDRANAAKDYIVKELSQDVNAIKFEINGKGADWDGFLKALNNSNIKDKAAIAKKISESKNKPGTLWLLKDKYPEIINLYPALRRAEVEVTTVK